MLALFMEPAPLLKIRMLIVPTAFSTAFDLAHSNWKVDYGALLHVSLHELDDCPKSSGFSSYYLLYLTCLLLWITWFIKNSFHPCLLKKEKEVTKDNIRRDSGGSLTLKKKKKILWDPVQNYTKKGSWMKENDILSTLHSPNDLTSIWK